MVRRSSAGYCLIRSELFNRYTSHGLRRELEAQGTLITTGLKAALSILHDILYDVTVSQVDHGASGRGREQMVHSRNSEWIKMADAPSTGGMGRKEEDGIWKEAGHEGPGKLLRGVDLKST